MSTGKKSRPLMASTPYTVVAFSRGISIFMKHLLAALVATAFSVVAFAQSTTPASPSAPQASSSTSAPAKSGTTKKAKKKKAKKPASSTNASGASPTK